MTPLAGPDGAIYAVGRGPVSISGFSAKGEAESLGQSVPTTGRVANGALVEREVAGQLDDEQVGGGGLRNPDFTTAVRIADTINGYTRKKYGRKTASESDQRTVSLTRPPNVGAARFLAEVGALMTEADIPARVIISERTGNRCRRQGRERFQQSPDRTRI